MALLVRARVVVSRRSSAQGEKKAKKKIVLVCEKSDGEKFHAEVLKCC